MLVGGCGSVSGTQLPRTAYGPEGLAVEHGTLLAAAGSPSGRLLGGVPCRKPQHPGYHVHTHLAVYVDGRLRPLPAGIGMLEPKSRVTRTGPFLSGPRCYYDLHVHAQDGVIHVEAPRAHAYTLGQFFAVWGQPLTGDRVGPARGRVTVYVDGQLSLIPASRLPLRQREVIQIDVGAPVPPHPVDWSHF